MAVAGQATTENNRHALLEGVVLHGTTKEPVRKAHVMLELARGTDDSELVFTTDESGRFRFADVKEGQYKLTVEKSGFLDGTYGADEPEEEGSLLRVTDGDHVQNLVLRLFPGGTIRGQVLDADDDPLSEHEVLLWTRVRHHGQIRNSHVRHATTNHAGEYIFEGLSPGTYYVSAAGGSWGDAIRQIPVDRSGKVTRTHDLTTFYPTALSLADAQSISVEGGQDQSGIDIHIQRGTTLSVKGRIPGTSGSPSQFSLSASVDEGMGWTSETATIQPDGDFVFKELPPGKHRLTLLDDGPNGLRPIGKAEVSLVDQDVTGMVITPFKPAQVRVHVVIEGEENKPLTLGSVFLIPIPPAEDDTSSLTQYQPQNGTYILDAVPPGKYRISFNSARDCYLKSLRMGEKSLDPESIEVAEGATPDLQMTYSRNVANLTGDVELAQDQSSRSLHVLVLSETPGEPSELSYREADLDQSLHFSMADIRPGKYLALATQEAGSDLWSNPDFVALLRSEAVEVELHEKEHATLHLKLIGKDETDGVRKRLGL